MALIGISGAQYAGVKRHYTPNEPIYFQLVDPNTGSLYLGGLLGSNINATVFFPDGTTWNKHVSPPPFTLTLGGAGFYRMALWGEGQVGGHDADLAQVGLCGIRIFPVSGEFSPIAIQYDVLPQFDVKLATTYVPGPAGTPMITGCVSIRRWSTQTFMASPLTATNSGGRTSVITGLTLTITDVSSQTTQNPLVTILGSDWTENTYDGNLYFTKQILGVTGARVLTGKLKFTYKGYQFENDYPIVGRNAA